AAGRDCVGAAEARRRQVPKGRVEARRGWRRHHLRSPGRKRL
ncbi:hypothetical protein BN1708_020670, partial [Verticillium longisporum]